MQCRQPYSISDLFYNGFRSGINTVMEKRNYPAFCNLHPDAIANDWKYQQWLLPKTIHRMPGVGLSHSNTLKLQQQPVADFFQVVF